MAQFTGFYSGVKDAMETQSQIDQRDSSTKLNQLAGQRAQIEMDEQAANKRILRNAFTAKIPEKVAKDAVSAASFLADQQVQAGQAILKGGGDPKAGIQLIKEGNETRQTAMANQYRDLQIKASQLDASGGVAAQVMDQSSLDAAIPELSKFGVVVPEKFRTWSPETKEWFDRRAIANKAYRESLLVQQKQVALGLKQEDTESKIETRAANIKLKEEKEQRARSGLDTTRKGSGYTPLSGKALEVTMGELSGDDSFKGLKPAEKLAASQDYADLIVAKLASGEAKNRMEARQMAKEDLKSRVNENGEYKPFEASKGPSLEEFITKAGAANPGYTKEQLTQEYNKRYK